MIDCLGRMALMAGTGKSGNGCSRLRRRELTGGGQTECGEGAEGLGERGERIKKYKLVNW